MHEATPSSSSFYHTEETQQKKWMLIVYPLPFVIALGMFFYLGYAIASRQAAVELQRQQEENARLAAQTKNNLLLSREGAVIQITLTPKPSPTPIPTDTPTPTPTALPTPTLAIATSAGSLASSSATSTATTSSGVQGVTIMVSWWERFGSWIYQFIY